MDIAELEDLMLNHNLPHTADGDVNIADEITHDIAEGICKILPYHLDSVKSYLKKKLFYRGHVTFLTVLLRFSGRCACIHFHFFYFSALKSK